MVSCDKNNYGCNGGYMNLSWQYLQNTGVVSEKCFPYGSTSGTAPACASKCADGSAFKKYKCKKNSIVHPTSVADIKTELTKGPVEGAFTVYDDFFNYKSGVYQHTTGG
jgi:cathepsin B